MIITNLVVQAESLPHHMVPYFSHCDTFNHILWKFYYLLCNYFVSVIGWYLFLDRPTWITMMSWWARWRLESPVSRVFTQPFIQGADQRIHQSCASLAFVRGIHRWPVNSPPKGPVTRKMFPFDDVIMSSIQPCEIAVGCSDSDL